MTLLRSYLLVQKMLCPNAPTACLKSVPSTLTDHARCNCSLHVTDSQPRLHACMHVHCPCTSHCNICPNALLPCSLAYHNGSMLYIQVKGITVYDVNKWKLAKDICYPYYSMEGHAFIFLLHSKVEINNLTSYTALWQIQNQNTFLKAKSIGQILKLWPNIKTVHLGFLGNKQKKKTVCVCGYRVVETAFFFKEGEVETEF